MKTKNFAYTSAYIFAMAVIAGCAHGNSAPNYASSGPTVVNSRMQPSTVVLNHDLQPNQPAEIVADVKDFNATVTNVRLKFDGAPLSVPMENVGGTTWRGQISPRELQSLAVDGKTVNYKADVIATDDKGNTAKSNQSVQVAIAAPAFRGNG